MVILNDFYEKLHGTIKDKTLFRERVMMVQTVEQTLLYYSSKYKSID